MKVDGRNLYFYKTWMMLSGYPSFVTVDVMSHKFFNVNYDKLSLDRSWLYELHGVAIRITRERSVSDLGTRGYDIQGEPYSNIRLWMVGKNRYFSIGKGNKFVLFKFSEGQFTYICTKA